MMCTFKVVEKTVFFEPKLTEEKPQLRFAEDIAGLKPEKPASKPKKKKKKEAHAKDTAEDGIKLKKARRGAELTDEDGEDYY